MTSLKIPKGGNQKLKNLKKHKWPTEKGQTIINVQNNKQKTKDW